jgi:hypothetical protein
MSVYIGASSSIQLHSYGKAISAGSGSPVWTGTNNAVLHVSAGKITGFATGTATVTVESNGYSASFEVTVSEDTSNTIFPTDLSSGDVLEFSDLRSDFSSQCREHLSESLSYITNLSVRPAQGVLYYSYISPEDPGTGVGATERYYYSDSVNGQRSISGITFLPNSTYSGTVTITYTGYSTSGKSFSGDIQFDVEGGNDVITYTTSMDTPLTLQASDFTTASRKIGGRDLNYLTFTLPSSSRGVLYYNYTGTGTYTEKVSSSEQYYRSRSPYLDQVTFVPASGYTGTVSISYRGVDSAGTSFNGRITITVAGGGTSSSSSSTTVSSSGNLTISGERQEAINLSASQFNTACKNAIDETLDYVRFELPSSSQGTLYYD